MFSEFFNLKSNGSTNSFNCDTKATSEKILTLVGHNCVFRLPFLVIEW
jgi:hypothetical protein